MTASGSQSRDGLSPSEFDALFDRGDWAALRGQTVRGRINRAGEAFDSAVSLRDITFLGDVNFSDCTFGGSVTFAGSNFSRNVKLANCQINGSLSLRRASLQSGESQHGRRFPGQFALDAAGTTVSGDLNLDLAMVTDSPEAETIGNGSVCLRNATIKGDFYGRGVVLDGELVLDNINIQGDLWLGSVFDQAQDTVVKGYFGRGVSARNARIEGACFWGGFLSGDNVILWGAHIGSSFFLGTLERIVGSPPTSTTVHSEIRGSLNLAAITVGGYVQIQGVTIRGELNLLSASATAVCLQYSLVKNARGEIVDCRQSSVGQIILTNCRIDADVLLYGTSVTGNHSPEHRGAIIANGAKIGADLRFWSAKMLADPDGDAQSPFDPVDEHAVVNGDLIIEGNASIGGKLDLTNVVVSGTVVVRDSEVTGDVCFSSSISLLNEPQTGTFKDKLEQAMERGGFLRALAHDLDLSMLTCHNDIDLTGLTLQRPSAVALPAGSNEDRANLHIVEQGAITARHLTIKGHLDLTAVHRSRKQLFGTAPQLCENICHHKVPDQALAGMSEATRGAHRHIAWCSVPEYADFSNLNAGRLRVSAHSFDDKTANVEKTKETGLILSNANLGELEIFDVYSGERTRNINKVHVPDGNFFPVPTDLGDINVLIWSIGDTNRARTDRYKAFIDSDRRFRRSTYRTIEASLRNRGHEEDADAIYMAMKEEGEKQRRTDERKAKVTAWSSLVWLGRLVGIAAVATLAIAVFVELASQQVQNNLPPHLLSILMPARWALALMGIGIIVPLGILAIAYARTRYFAYKSLLAFGTSPLRLLGLIFALWLAMLPAYLVPENYEPSVAALAKSDNPPALAAPPEDWSAQSALMVSLSHHIPMLGIIARDEWDLRDSGTLDWALTVDERRLEPPRWVAGTLTPEDWGILMQIINWILWPLVLTFIIRKAVRTSGQ